MSSIVVAHGLSCPVARGILVPLPGIEPTSPALEGRFFTTVPPRKSLVYCLICLNHSKESDLLKCIIAVYTVQENLIKLVIYVKCSRNVGFISYLLMNNNSQHSLGTSSVPGPVLRALYDLTHWTQKWPYEVDPNIFPFCRGGNWGTESLSSLSKDTQLLRRIQIPVVQLQSPHA